MEENKKNQPKFGTAVNTKKNAGQQGAEVLRQFMLDKYQKDPATMTKAEKKAFRKMAKELLKVKKITREDYDMILEALK